jgi:hypothetical protein
MTIAIAEPITVCTYGFNIPSRRFLIRANVTRDRRLPVVDEFVLRVLKLCERVPVRRLSGFFGFSEAETEAVLADLTSSGLVMLDGEMASLHISAHDHFRGSEEGIPRVVDVDSWVERLWFDLVSRNMIAPDRARPAGNLIDIRASEMARDLPITYARKAFEENFAEYLRKIRRLANPDRFALYSVSDVVPERFGSVVLRGQQELVLDPHPRLKANLIEIEAEDLAKFRPLANALNDAYLRLTEVSPSAAALAEFSRLAADTSVTEAYGGTARFDLGRWLSINAAKENPERQTLVGAPYLHRNLDFLTKLIDRSAKSGATIESAAKKIEILWCRPFGSAWGASPDLRETLVAIKLALRRKYGKVAVRTKLIIPQISRRDAPRRFDRLFDEGYIAPAGYLSPSIEIVHIWDTAVMLLVSVSFSESVSAFVGFATTESSSVDRVRRMLRPGDVDVRLEEVWKTERREEESPAIELEPDNDPDS